METYGNNAYYEYDDADLERIERDLRVYNKAAEAAEQLGTRSRLPAFHDCWSILPSGLVEVPRTYDWDRYNPKEYPRIVWPEPEIRPWSAQLPALWAIKDQDSALLVLGCGRGKTVIALIDAARRGRKTIVFVDRDFLLEQWVERACDVFGCEPSAIGIIKGKKRPKVDHFLTIAMAKTASNMLESEGGAWLDEYGHAIYDECHSCAAPTVVPLLWATSGTRLGLSATPKRRDGMQDVFLWHLGREPAYVDVSRSKAATWTFVLFARPLVDPSRRDLWRRTPYRDRGDNPVMALRREVYDTLALENEVFLKRVERDIRKAVNAGRSLLVLGTRVEPLKELQDRLVAAGVSCVAVDAKTKPAARRAAFADAQVILATPALASRALDIPRLDTLFLLMPSADEGFLRQAVGRLDRDASKLPPIVVTYADGTYRSLQRKVDEMCSLITNDLDPKGRILRVTA